MKEYRRLNFNKLHFAKNTISSEEALKNVTPVIFPEEVINGTKKITVNTAEKDYENKCVKLEIFY